MSILDKIVSDKQKEISQRSVIRPVGELEKSKYFFRSTVSLSDSVTNKARSGIIAEFKRRSPSKGIINQTATIEEVAAGYFHNGASAISVLTDEKSFGGTNEDIISVRENIMCPVLRKDFTISEYQVIETKAIGADAILIIAAILEKREILKFSKLARSLGLEVLFEIHDRSEFDKVNDFINLIGVNNRDLKTFKVDTDLSVTLASEFPDGFVRVSESGISSAEQINRLRSAGYQGFLIGEKFMSSPEPVDAFKDFMKEIQTQDQC